MSKYNFQLPIEITRKNSSNDFQTGPSSDAEIQNKPFEILNEDLMRKYNLKLPIEITRITSEEFDNEPSGMEIENESFTVSSKSLKNCHFCHMAMLPERLKSTFFWIFFSDRVPPKREKKFSKTVDFCP